MLLQTTWEKVDVDRELFLTDTLADRCAVNGGNKMIGNPKYSKGQKVKFVLNETEEIIGEIDIIDAYGTFWQNEEVSYDIMCKENNTLYKHIRESWVSLV